MRITLEILDLNPNKSPTSTVDINLINDLIKANEARCKYLAMLDLDNKWTQCREMLSTSLLNLQELQCPLSFVQRFLAKMETKSVSLPEIHFVNYIVKLHQGGIIKTDDDLNSIKSELDIDLDKTEPFLNSQQSLLKY